MKGLFLLVGALVTLPAMAQSHNPLEKKNWFGDPFFQVSKGLAACPAPEGPMLTFEEQRLQAHWRAERGTSCWLAGKCKDSNAYRYDKTLAPQVEAALKALPELAVSSVWVTVQRRWVFLEGCVASPEHALKLEQAVKSVPEVEAVVPALMIGARGKPPYALAPRKGSRHH
ncbi:MAG TPA: BON domain-containing protein [Polaromonas sp.]|uniref:BON domain-containing protein n=1 Tax=Polaromonas sp. TaxID=1869339 RepID=UPI002D224857|nr:BON domain-containing protein [Polaromonas sp.]HYW55577.1 BON domain-containing protein [Polaromonas sp.]